MIKISHRVKGKLTQIGVCKGKLFGLESFGTSDAITLIDTYLKNTLDPSFEAPYFRIIYHEEDGTATVDYGSHVDFMILEEIKEEN